MKKAIASSQQVPVTTLQWTTREVRLPASLGEGGYEPTESRVAPPKEFLLKSAIARLFEPRPGLPAPPVYADKLHILSWRDRIGVEHPVTSRKDWSKRRADIMANMELVMGQLRGPTRKVPLDARVAESVDCGKFTRRKIVCSNSHTRCPARAAAVFDRVYEKSI
jgi:hypothetical protein